MEEREETLYLPDTAEVMAARRREEAKSLFGSVSATCLEEIKARLALYHSPEQIAGRLKREGKEWVSHETIYQMIYVDYEGWGSIRTTYVTVEKDVLNVELDAQAVGRFPIA
jgi:transposase, IS30 family